MGGLDERLAETVRRRLRANGDWNINDWKDAGRLHEALAQAEKRREALIELVSAYRAYYASWAKDDGTRERLAQAINNADALAASPERATPEADVDVDCNAFPEAGEGGEG